MNMIGRQSRHTAITRTPSDRGLQHEGLFQVDHVRPVERSINLATIRTGKGVALRGNERRNQRDTKVWQRIVRSTNTTIVTVTRRGRQHANIVPPLSQEDDHPARGGSKPVTARIEVINDEQDFEPGGYLSSHTSILPRRPWQESLAQTQTTPAVNARRHNELPKKWLLVN